MPDHVRPTSPIPYKPMVDGLLIEISHADGALSPMYVEGDELAFIRDQVAELLKQIRRLTLARKHFTGTLRADTVRVEMSLTYYPPECFVVGERRAA